MNPQTTSEWLDEVMEPFLFYPVEEQRHARELKALIESARKLLETLPEPALMPDSCAAATTEFTKRLNLISNGDPNGT